MEVHLYKTLGSFYIMMLPQVNSIDDYTVPIRRCGNKELTMKQRSNMVLNSLLQKLPTSQKKNGGLRGCHLFFFLVVVYLKSWVWFIASPTYLSELCLWKADLTPFASITGLSCVLLVKVSVWEVLQDMSLISSWWLWSLSLVFETMFGWEVALSCSVPQWVVPNF